MPKHSMVKILGICGSPRRRSAYTALQAALEDSRCAAEIELSGYGKIAGELLDYVNKLIETVVIAGEKNPKVTVTITI